MIDLFVPEFWSTRLLRHLDAALRYAQPALTNRNYEGEISNAGDTVHIQKVGDPTIQDYVKGDPMVPERPEGSTIALTIDRDKGFYVQMDDLDAVQVNVALFDEFTGRAGRKMAEVVDADVAARQVAAAHVDNQVGTDADPISVKADGSGDFTPYDLAVELNRLLDEKEAPEDGRWMVINPTFRAELVKDPNYISSGSEAAAQLARNGQIGELDGFSVLRTTRTPTSPGSGGVPVPNWKLVCGVGNYATTFANQLLKTEAERLEGLFEDAVKGRNVWGAKIVEPETLGLAHIEV